MNGIRKFAYAAALTLSTLSFTPSLASAQDAGGSFTLRHEVHWQKSVVPAGNYKFTIEPNGPLELLTLHKIGGTGASFLMLVTEVEESQASGFSRLVVVSRSGERFVEQMQLPEFGVTLRFAVPKETREVAQAAGTPVESAAR